MELLSKTEIYEGLPQLYSNFHFDRKIISDFRKSRKIPIFESGNFYGYADEELKALKKSIEQRFCCACYAIFYQQDDSEKSYIFVVLPYEVELLRGAVQQLDPHIYTLFGIYYNESEGVDYCKTIMPFVYCSRKQFGVIGFAGGDYEKL